MKKIIFISASLFSCLSFAVDNTISTPPSEPASGASISPKHGATQYPMARQVICKTDGGYNYPDDGSGIPNQACRSAFTYDETTPVWERRQMFDEWPAYSQNLEGTTHPKDKVPDEQLCSAGIKKFKGINEPHADWKASPVSVYGDIALLFYTATQVHEPSKWTVYLSNPDFDSSTQRLKWSDLEELELKRVDHVEAKSESGQTKGPGQYLLQVKLPENYQQDKKSVIYVQWERTDPARETFFSCSDVIFKASDSASDLAQQF